MTVISAALTKKDGIVIVGDSSVTGGFSKDEDGYNKLWVEKENGQFIFGGCGGVRPMQVIKHWISWPYYRDGMNLEEFAVGNKGPWTKGQVINSVKKSAATAIGVGGPLWVATTNSMSVVLVEP